MSEPKFHKSFTLDTQDGRLGTCQLNLESSNLLVTDDGEIYGPQNTYTSASIKIDSISQSKCDQIYIEIISELVSIEKAVSTLDSKIKNATIYEY